MRLINIVLGVSVLLFSCNKLDLDPLTQASAEKWYSTEEGVVSGINYLFRSPYWTSNLLNDEASTEWADGWTDDWTNRNAVSLVTGGTLNSLSGIVTTNWRLRYECIANANIVLASLEMLSGQIEEDRLNRYVALARFARAYQYSLLVVMYGDVPYYENWIDVDEAFALVRTDKETVLQHIYDDFDFAAEHLPVAYGSGEVAYAAKGAALGFKARVALRMGDWETVRSATQACMELDVYELLPEFDDVLTQKQSNETIYARPRSAELGVTIGQTRANQVKTRTPGGTDFVSPSWELFSAFLCVDGLPIDESPLYNPREPFENRDPRCAKTITPFGARHYGVVYEPHPDTLKVYSFTNGAYVTNNDSKSNTQWASFNGLVWRKGITEDTWLNVSTVDPDDILLRYADVLLMYAEAKTELNDIDDSVLEAINRVRARAYGVDYTDVSAYPSVTTTDQGRLRQTIRLERRMELAFECLRYFDIIRWRIAEDVLNKPIYGLLDLDELRSKIVANNLWFFPATPSIDEDGVADFSEMYQNGLIKLLARRVFDPSKQYLWPIPATEIEINPKLKQNPGY